MKAQYYHLNKQGKAVAVEWENGTKEGIPFYVKESLEDFDGDGETYFNHVEGLRKNHEEERSFTRDESEPVPSEFPSEAIYQAKHSEWQNEDFFERHKPPEPKRVPASETLPPDEYRLKREKLFLQRREWAEKLEDCQYRGDRDGMDRAKDQIRWIEKDLDAIPEAAFQRVVREGNEGHWRNTVSLLFDTRAEVIRDQIWGTDRMDHDIMDALQMFNNFDSGNTVILPKEAARGTGRAGKFKKLMPGNFIKVEFKDRAEKEEFIRSTKGGGDPYTFIRSRLGLDLDDKEKLSIKQLEEAPEEVKISKMSQTQFETYRATGKIYPDADLEALNRSQLETLQATKEWPQGVKSPEEKPAEEAVSLEEFQASLTPYKPEQEAV